MMRCIGFALLAVASLLAGCATAVRGETEQVTFVSEPSGAKMETSTGRACVTPCTLEIPRRETFTAKFTLQDQADKDHIREVFVDTEIPDAVAATTAANILLTPIILIPAAIAIDAASGANLNHTPNPVIAKFEGVEAREEDIADVTASVDDSPEDPEKPQEPEEVEDRTFKLDNTSGTETAAASTAATVVAAAPVTEPEPENAIWVNVTLDMTSGLHYHCTHFSGAENKLLLDGSAGWQPIKIRHDPGVELFARVRSSTGQPAIEFWQSADGGPEQDAFRVPMPSLEPGASARLLTSLRSIDPYDVCGHFTIFVDVVPGPAQS